MGEPTTESNTAAGEIEGIQDRLMKLANRLVEPQHYSATCDDLAALVAEMRKLTYHVWVLAQGNGVAGRRGR